MMSFECRVVGHELVFKKDQRLVKIKLKNMVEDLKVELLVHEDDRVKYPFGSTAVLRFDVQQTLPLSEREK